MKNLISVSYKYYGKDLFSFKCSTNKHYKIEMLLYLSDAAMMSPHNNSRTLQFMALVLLFMYNHFDVARGTVGRREKIRFVFNGCKILLKLAN